MAPPFPTCVKALCTISLAGIRARNVYDTCTGVGSSGSRESTGGRGSGTFSWLQAINYVTVTYATGMQGCPVQRLPKIEEPEAYEDCFTQNY